MADYFPGKMDVAVWGLCWCNFGVTTIAEMIRILKLEVLVVLAGCSQRQREKGARGRLLLCLMILCEF